MPLVAVPQQGTLDVMTECGRMTVRPNEICVIPQGMRFNVALREASRGYVLEVWGTNFIVSLISFSFALRGPATSAA